MQNGISNILQENPHRLTAKEMFFKYLVYLPWFILSIGITITIGYLYIRYSVPLYNSSISILIKNDPRRATAPSEITLDNLTLSRNINLSNEMMVLKSASTMKRVVTSLGLGIQYFNKGKVKPNSELYQNSPVQATVLNVLDSSKEVSIEFKKDKEKILATWEGKTSYVTNNSIINTSKGNLKLNIQAQNLQPAYKYFIKWRTDWSIAGELAGKLDVRQQNKDAAIVQITITTELPQKGSDILNQLVKEYDQVTIEERNKLALSSIQFIDDRLNILSNELGKVEDNLQIFQSKNKILDLAVQGTAGLQKISVLENDLSQQEVQLSVLNMIRDYVSNPARKFELVPSTLGIPDATLNVLIQNYNNLQLSREEELRSIPSTHPIIQTKEHQIEKVRLSILENLNNVKRSAENVKQQKQRQYNAASSSLSTIPEKKREIQEIERQQAIKEKLYVFLLQKREELAITKASTTGNVTAVDPAASWGPVNPNTSNVYRIALIFGLFIPFGIIYLKDLLNDKVITRTDLTKATQCPIIGEVAHHESMTRKFVVGMKERGVLSEQFRIIRTNLQFLLAHAPTKNPVILVTSSIAGEGKTFCSMNMAAVWAVAGKKTVILELDLRKPKVSRALNLHRDIGISNYIIGNTPKEELPQPFSEIPNLYVISAGPIPPNPSELIMDNKMDQLFTYLRANFDVIIIDSAPMGLVSDSKILSRFADATLFVVRQRYTMKKQMLFVEELYQQKVLPNMGLIANDVKLGGTNSYYGYGYGYGYGYSYNYNYNYTYSYGEKTKRTFVQKIKDIVGL